MKSIAIAPTLNQQTDQTGLGCSEAGFELVVEHLERRGSAVPGNTAVATAQVDPVDGSSLVQAAVAPGEQCVAAAAAAPRMPSVGPVVAAGSVALDIVVVSGIASFRIAGQEAELVEALLHVPQVVGFAVVVAHDGLPAGKVVALEARATATIPAPTGRSGAAAPAAVAVPQKAGSALLDFVVVSAVEALRWLELHDTVEAIVVPEAAGAVVAKELQEKQRGGRNQRNGVEERHLQIWELSVVPLSPQHPCC